MTTISHFLFPAPAARSPAAIFRWWEARRLGYNAIVGATGLFSLGIVTALAHLPPGPTELPPFGIVFAYAIGANIFYCLGPFAEYALEMIWPGKVMPTGPVLFRMGLTFSLGLNFLAIPIMTWDWLVRVLNWLL